MEHLSDENRWLLFPNAKINLHLEIGGKRPDNMHELFSFFYPIDLRDRMEVVARRQPQKLNDELLSDGEKLSRFIASRLQINTRFTKRLSKKLFGANKTGREQNSQVLDQRAGRQSLTKADSIGSSVAEFCIPNQENSIFQAWMALYRCAVQMNLLDQWVQSACQFIWNVDLIKRIPPESGLGGGSADAAFFIRLLAFLLPKLPRHLFLQAAKQTGADVTFFLYNEPSFWGGGGERRLASYRVGLPRLPLILIRDWAGFSTALAYASLKRQTWNSLDLEAFRVERQKRAIAWSEQDLATLSPVFTNDFETYAYSCQPELKNALDAAIGSSVIKILHAGLTGSGSVYYLLFAAENPLNRVIEFKKELQKKWPWAILSFLKCDDGLSPSGKAADFGSAIPRFESWQAR